jgi:hypothetical protein
VGEAPAVINNGGGSGGSPTSCVVRRALACAVRIAGGGRDGVLAMRQRFNEWILSYTYTTRRSPDRALACPITPGFLRKRGSRVRRL